MSADYQRNDPELLRKGFQSLQERFGGQLPGDRQDARETMLRALCEALDLAAEQAGRLLEDLEASKAVTWVEELQPRRYWQIDPEAFSRAAGEGAAAAQPAAEEAPASATVPPAEESAPAESPPASAPAATARIEREPEALADWRVVIFASPDDTYALRDTIVETLGMHPTDAMIRANSAPAILPDLFTAGQAELLASAIDKQGLQAEAIPQSEIPDFGHPEPVHHAKCLDAGLEILEMHGEEETMIPWPQVELVSVGNVPQEIARHMLVETEPIPVTSARRTSRLPLEVQRRSGPELLVVRREPRLAFRMDHERMSYEYLGLRKTDSAARNFRLFVEDLVARASEAYLPPATRAFLKREQPIEYQFDSPEELRRYTVFHLLLRQRLVAQQRG